MKISLRKANVIQNNINEALRSIEIADTVSISEYQNIEQVIADKATEAQINLQRKTALISALYSIRNVVGKANAQAGIDEKLTQTACVEKMIQLMTEQTKRTVRTEAAVLAGKAEKMRKSENDRSLYYNNDSLTTGITSEEDIATARVALASLKKDKQRLQDEILELNVRTEVELSEHVAGTLKFENLL
jgi:hypothetical protein